MATQNMMIPSEEKAPIRAGAARLLTVSVCVSHCIKLSPQHYLSVISVNVTGESEYVKLALTLIC